MFGVFQKEIQLLNIKTLIHFPITVKIISNALDIFTIF